MKKCDRCQKEVKAFITVNIPMVGKIPLCKKCQKELGLIRDE
jgi:predicted SprT family Zn-dependent metalloprotease